MNALRRSLLPLLLIPAGMFIYVLIYPDWQWDNPGLESLFAVVGLPILIINFIAWFYPEIITTYLPGVEHWGQRESPSSIMAVVLSMFVAFTCVCAGASFAVASASPRPTVESFAVQPMTATAFARSVQSFSSATTSSESVSIPTPRASPEASLLPGETPQIPVSGGEATSPAALSVAPTAATSLSTTPISTVSTGSTSAAATRPTATARPLGSCTPASADYIEAIGATVQDMDTENAVTTGWMVQSKTTANLVFVAAKIQSDTGTTSMGLWALSLYTDGTFDIYSINQTAMDLSSADWGEDSDPVITMQTDGAQAALSCAA